MVRAVRLIRTQSANTGEERAPTIPRHNGKPIPIHGRKLALLRVLAQSAEPLSVEALREAWDITVEDSTVRWQISELRKSLSGHFPDVNPIISRLPSGYFLQLR